MYGGYRYAQDFNPDIMIIAASGVRAVLYFLLPRPRMVYVHTVLGYHCTCHKTLETPETSKNIPLLPRSVCARLSPSCCLLVLVSRQARYFSCNHLQYLPYLVLTSLLFLFGSLSFSPIHPFLSISAFFSSVDSPIHPHTLSPSLVMQHGPDHHQESKSHRHGWINSASDPTDHPHPGLFQPMVS